MRAILFLALVGCNAAVETPADAPADASETPTTAEPAPTVPDGMEEVALFGGRTGNATRHHEPAEGTIEHAILKSLELIAAGDHDGWMTAYCHEDACGDERMQESMKSHVLPAAQGAMASCTHDGDLLVTKQEEENGFTKTWIYCGASRMPAPSTAENVDGEWRFSSISW